MPEQIIEKTCSKCGETKPSERFYKMATAKDGRRPNCRACSMLVVVPKNGKCSCGQRWLRKGATECSLCKKARIPSLYKTDECACGKQKAKEARRCSGCNKTYQRTRVRHCRYCEVTLTTENKSANGNKCKPCVNERTRGNPDLQRNARRWKFRLKQEVIVAYGGMCACCGENTDPRLLTVDHVFNDGSKERHLYSENNFYAYLKKHGFPRDRYQLLCWTCNMGKHYGKEHQCPHQLAVNDLWNEFLEYAAVQIAA